MPSKLPYICNEEDISKVHKENTSIGTYHFIIKKDEKTYNAYRKVERFDRSYYVLTSLPHFLFNELIQSNKVAKVLYS